VKNLLEFNPSAICTLDAVVIENFGGWMWDSSGAWNIVWGCSPPKPPVGDGYGV